MKKIGGNVDKHPFDHFPKILPHKNVPEYFLSRRFTQNYNSLSASWSLKPVNQDGDLVNAQMKLDQVDEDLRGKRATCKEEMRKIGEEWRELEVMETKLRDDFVKFNDFVENNVQKRNRADKHLKQLNVLNKIRELEIYRMKDRLKKIKIVIEKMEEANKNHQIYPNLMQKIVEEYPEKLQKADDIIYNYILLLDVNREVMDNYRKSFGDLYADHAKCQAIAEEGTIRLLGLKTQRGILYKKHKEARQKCMYLEVLLGKLLTKLVTKYVEGCATRLASENLHKFSLERKKREAETPGDKEEMFEHFKDELKILRLVTGKLTEEEWGSLIGVKSLLPDPWD